MYTVRIDGFDQSIPDLPTLAVKVKTGEFAESTPVYDHASGEWKSAGDIISPPASAQTIPPPPTQSTSLPSSPVTSVSQQAIAITALESYKGTIILRHPVSGDQKKLTVHTSGTWMFLFGPFYLMYHKVWLQAFICLASSLLVPGAWLIWMFFSKKLIANRHLKAGYQVIAHYPDGKEPKPAKK